ncbi:MAG: hypothetical protein QXL35_00345 [Candidatus Bathyarchaeia archaeon]
MDVVPSFLAFLPPLPDLLKADTTFIDLVRAQEIRVEYNLDWRIWDDLVIAARIEWLGIDEIYSNDEGFDPKEGVFE